MTTLLARWGLLLAIVVAGLFVTFFGAFGAVAARPEIGKGYDELLMAAFAPGLYRVAMVFDALGWLFMGGLIVIAGAVLWHDGGVRARFGAICGIGAMAGIIGGFLRLAVMGDLGQQYAAAGADQAPIVMLARTVLEIVAAHFAAGQLTVGLGFAAVGAAALSTAWVPRTIAWLLALPAVTTFALLATHIVLDTFLFPVVLVHVALLAAAGLACARTWWSVEALAPLTTGAGDKRRGVPAAEGSDGMV